MAGWTCVSVRLRNGQVSDTRESLTESTSCSLFAKEHRCLEQPDQPGRWGLVYLVTPFDVCQPRSNQPSGLLQPPEMRQTDGASIAKGDGLRSRPCKFGKFVEGSEPHLRATQVDRGSKRYRKGKLSAHHSRTRCIGTLDESS